MTNSNSNYQIGQSTHREYEAKYGQSAPRDNDKPRTVPNLLKLVSVLGSLILVGSILGQLVA